MMSDFSYSWAETGNISLGGVNRTDILFIQSLSSLLDASYSFWAVFLLFSWCRLGVYLWPNPVVISTHRRSVNLRIDKGKLSRGF
ncbi:hypothetical protein M430DRAFT_173414 [Amorphotheca resinae ATCC 22711]|uniref:Uncharacterized protein n=1 Tax=Amorphotheca resinae ATCC 22711 TaxID=857342 RepID=A0A2T3AVE4_AMORE|nr:hypothetical protein M430DRAFT_173414 [Amorphotheca resinae ATCC 22711]PSS12626.1 hypothetical protein M430DRAFT_173414 [Amorphotheca resinae ATCC 22711]